MGPSQENAEHGASATFVVAQNRSAPANQPPLSALDRRTVALRLGLPGHDEILVGRCIYERDPHLGAVLRIELPSSAACEFLIVERTWNGEIVSGQTHGCDYLIRLG